MADYRPSWENNTYIYRLMNRETGKILAEGETSGRGSRSDQEREARTKLMRDGFHPFTDPSLSFWMKKKEENGIRNLRESTGLNRKQFCEKYGIPYRTMQDWEDGKSKPVEWAENLLIRAVKSDFNIN